MSRARWAAWTSLGIAFAGAVVSRVLPPFSAEGWLRAASDAALAGGLADLYAVSALFRRPFGLPVPHTAIIPQSRAQLIEGAKSLVTRYWLSREALALRVRDIDAAAFLAQELDEHAATLAELASGWTAAWVDKGGLHKVLVGLLVRLKDASLEENLSSLLGLLAVRLVESGAHERVFDELLDTIRNNLETPAAQDAAERIVLDFLSTLQKSPRMSKYTFILTPLLGMLDIRSISLSLLSVLSDLLLTVRNDLDNVHRVHILASVREYAQRSHEWAPRLAQGGLAWVSSHADAVGEDLAARIGEWLRADLAQPESKVRAWMVRSLQRAADRLRDEASLGTTVNQAARDRLAAWVDQYHDQLGTMVEESLNKLSDPMLVAMVEDRVGHHLQWIRVNGAVVGALVGIVIYALSIAFA